MRESSATLRFADVACRLILGGASYVIHNGRRKDGCGESQANHVARQAQVPVASELQFTGSHNRAVARPPLHQRSVGEANGGGCEREASSLIGAPLVAHVVRQNSWYRLIAVGVARMT